MENNGNLSQKARKVIPVVLVVLSMLVGISLMLYPTVADRINQSVNNKAISEYKQKLTTLDRSEYDEIINKVKEYNSRLFEETPYIGELTDKKRQEYEELLDTTGTGIMGYIEIEDLDIELAIYHGTSDAVLQTGVGHMESSSLPMYGESVHVLLLGHSGLPSARLFSDLSKLELGDTFKVHVLNETLTYEVDNIDRVRPEDLADLHIQEGKELCTLLTCTPYGVNSHRLVISSHRIDTHSQTTEPDEQETEKVGINYRHIIIITSAALVLLAGLLVYLAIYKKRKKYYTK